MLTDLTLRLWVEAIATAVYLRNRLPNRSIGNSTPYESLYNKKPLIQHLRPYGTKCFVHIPEESRKPGTKLQPRAIEGYLVGYTSSTKIYRIYIPLQHKISETRQLHWTTKTITPLEPMDPPTIPETFATIHPPSFPIATQSQNEPKETEQDETPKETTVEVHPPPPPDNPEEYVRPSTPTPPPDVPPEEPPATRTCS